MSIALPRLIATDALVVAGHPELELVDVAQLATTGELVIADNPKLVAFDGTPAARTARIENNRALPADVAARLGAP